MLSPTAMGYLPILVLHLVILGYLLIRKNKSLTAWLFAGWMASWMLLVLSKFAASAIYTPLGGYIDWIGGLVSAWLGLTCALQFAYYFPNPGWAVREARAVLVIMGGIGAGLLLMILCEATFTPKLPSYNFAQFWYGLTTSGNLWLSSFGLFDILHPLGQVWVVIIWVRKTIYLSADASREASETRLSFETSGWRRALQALWQPQGREAQATRTLAVVSTLVPIIVLLHNVEVQGALPAGSFATTYMLALFILVLTYLNHGAIPTSLIVKLAGIALLTVLVILELAGRIMLNESLNDYEQARQDDLVYLRSLVANYDVGSVPPAVQYIAARPADGGLFSAQYRMLFSRLDGQGYSLNAQDLADQDALMKSSLEQGHFEVLLENPWLGPIGQDQRRLSKRVENKFISPEGAPAYRGVFDNPEGHYIRYTFASEDRQTLYEVGYSYLAYRQALHQKALPVVYLLAGTTLAMLLIFPRFFKVNLVLPVYNLMGGMAQVDAGNLGVVVPVLEEDEIGFLTQAFNKTVRSLQDSKASLQLEIARRQIAEEQLQALNLTLEQQVIDRTRDLSALYAVSAIANQATGSGAILNESLSQTVTTMQAEAGLIHLLGEAQEALAQSPSLVCLAVPGFPMDTLDRLRGWLTERDVVEWLMAQRESVLIPNAVADPRLPEILQRGYPLTLLLTKVQARGQTLGIVCLARKTGHTFNVEELALLASIADQIGLAVQSDRLRQQAAVLEERQRIGRDLHDSITQSLYGLAALAEAGQLQLETGALDALGHTFGFMGEATCQALREMRLFIYQLRPLALEQEGLVGAIHERLAAVEGRANVQARLLADETIRLPQPVEVALYQITCEALNNALRHARAASVSVCLSREGEAVLLEIVDDGCGFDPATLSPGGMGLANMRARIEEIGGRLDIVTQPGRGTQVKMMVESRDASREVGTLRGE
ncbi:MAG: GAF domain-containing protein [Thermoflexales bacterium]|nr:GAF domain-containing protein [Thermoflexales bacterium]